MNVWGRIYTENIWHGVESLSGPGSGSAATRHVAPAIVSLVERYGITSVLDVGCGDGFWMPDLPGYIGLDVSPVAIERGPASATPSAATTWATSATCDVSGRPRHPARRRPAPRAGARRLARARRPWSWSVPPRLHVPRRRERRLQPGRPAARLGL